MGVLIRAK